MSDSKAASRLSAEERALIGEEERWLERARGAIAAEGTRRAGRHVHEGHRSTDALRRLREEAMSTSEDDLPGVLHEMSVRQALVERGDAGIPDEAAPYFAHLRVREGGVEKDYFLGSTSLVDASRGVRIVDWRKAPVARVFYGYREGDDYEEEFPGRTAEGTVVARRLVVVENGELARVVSGACHLVRASGEWERVSADRGAFHAGGAETAARPAALGTGVGSGVLPSNVDVTALLDAEQYAAVTAPLDTPLLVLGSAGSGKTTVALHRLARLTPEHGAASVVVPERGLSKLWARLLAPYGAGVHSVRTLDDWALDAARAVFGRELPRISGDTPALVSSLKRHPALFHALSEHFAATRRKTASFRRLKTRLATLLSDAVFLGRVVEASRGTLSRAAIAETVRHTMAQLGESFDRVLESVVVPEMKQAIDGRRVTADTPDDIAGTIDVEDLPLVLWLHAASGGPLPERFAHLVLDEAEDFAAFELSVMGRMLAGPRGVTLAGDEAQQTSSCFAGWPASLARLGVPEAAEVRLGVSYRCPEPVVAFARGLLDSLATATATAGARVGAPVGRFAFPDEAQSQLFVLSAISDLIEREPRASTAVIAESAGTAAAMYELLGQHPSARLVLEGEFTFEPGIDVTHVDAVQGLEFDYVVVTDASASAYPATDDARRRLHVAATRAAHQLWVVSPGVPSPILPA